MTFLQGLGTISETLAPFLFSVIHMATDLKNPSSVYLLEDGLELWMAVLHNSKNMLPHWMELTKNMPPILGASFVLKNEKFLCWF
jgi:hypothetical protein